VADDPIRTPASGREAVGDPPRVRSRMDDLGVVVAAGLAYAAATHGVLADGAARTWGIVLAALPLLFIAWRIRAGILEPAIALLHAGCGVLAAAVAGLAFGLPQLAGVVPDQTPLSPDGLLCMALLLAGAQATAHGRTRWGAALFVAAAVPAAATLAAWLHIPPRGEPPAIFDLGWSASQRMQPLHALAPVAVAAAGFAASALRDRRGADAAAWLVAVACLLAAMVSLVASAVGARESTIHLSHASAAVPSALVLAAVAGWLVLRARRIRDGATWLPVLAGMVLTAGALKLAWIVEIERQMRLQREAEVAADATQAAIEGAFQARLASIDRFAQRLLAVSPAERPRLFEVEAEQALRANFAMQSVARVDAQRIVRQIATLSGSRRLIGLNAALDANRARAYERAERSGQAVALGPLLLAATQIEAMLVIYPGTFGDSGTEFLVAGYRLADMLALALDRVAPGYAIEATIDGQRRVLRGEAIADPHWAGAATRSFSALDAEWTITLAPDRAAEQGAMPVSRAIVSAGLLVGVLVALALQLAARARERAAAAEAAIKALHAESAARASSEAALARSEQQAQRLLEGMSDGVLTLDRELRITFANRRASEMITGRRTDPVGQPVGEVFAHFENSPFAPGFREVLAHRRSIAMEGYSPTIGRWLSGRVHPIDDGLTAIFDDVTEIRLAEAFERDQREVLRAIASGRPLDECIAGAIALFESRFAGSAAAVLRLDAGTRRIEAVIAPSLPDTALHPMVGSRLTDDAGCCGAAAATGGRATCPSIADDERWRAHGKPLLEAGFHACWSQAILAADGTVLGTFSAYLREPREASDAESAAAQSVAALAGIAIERHLDALRVETERQRFRSLSERSPYLVYAFDVERRLVDCNDNVVRDGGYSREQLLGLAPEALVLKPWRETVRRGFDAALRGESSRFDAAVRTAQGVRREVEITLVPIAVDQRITGVFGVVRDTTEERRIAGELDRALRDLTARNRELQDFAYVASHDLQEPLRKVQAFSDRVMQRYTKDLDPQAVDYLRRIDGAANRMQVLIDDLLAYSRVTSQGQPFAPVDLGDVLDDVLSDLEVRIEDSGAHVEAGPLPVVEGDRTQLRQLLQNLLANAIKFRAPGRPPRIRIEAGTTPEQPGSVRLSVEDNGIGFDPAHAERIFAPFQRLHGRHEYEGTGIGLAVVRRIIERHHGRITAVGHPGEGARFEVTLPLRGRS